MSEMHDVIVVGGGIAGLAAAWDLRNRDVVVLEAADRVGGRIRSETRGDHWINVGAHVFAGAGSASDRLIRDTGVEAVPVPGRLTSIAMNGAFINSGRVETFPLRIPMPAKDRAALLKTGARLRVEVAKLQRLSKPRPGESPRETELRVMGYLADRSFSDWTGPLPPDTDAMLRATITRSTAESEQLTAGQGIHFFALVWTKGGGLSNNIAGGSQVLLDAIARELEGRIQLSTPVERVVQHDDHVVVRHGDGELKARHVVLATQAYETVRIAPELPGDVLAALSTVPYGPLIVMGLLTDETQAMPYDDLYALATPKQPFNMMFNMSNILRRPGRPRVPGGSLFVYRNGDRGAWKYLEMSDEEVEREWVDALCGLFPDLRGHVAETIILRMPRSLPYPSPGYDRVLQTLEQPLGRLHLAGDYLGGSYTETSIASGQSAALAVRHALQTAGVTVA
jgi:oxygen-dependent protoporphyrinogen oxidase